MYLDMSKKSRHIFVMPMALSIAPLHSLNHNDQNNMKHGVFSYVMQLVPALLSCDANVSSIVSVCLLREDN